MHNMIYLELYSLCHIIITRINSIVVLNFLSQTVLKAMCLIYSHIEGLECFSTEK